MALQQTAAAQRTQAAAAQEQVWELQRLNQQKSKYASRFLVTTELSDFHEWFFCHGRIQRGNIRRRLSNFAECPRLHLYFFSPLTLAFESVLACQHLVQHRPERENISPRIRLPA